MNSSQGLSVFSGNDYQEKKSSSSLIGFFDEPHAPAQNVSTQRASSKLAGFFDEPPMPAQSTTFAHAGRKPYVDDFEALIRSEGAQVYAPVIRAIYKQESGGGTNARTSTDGARGGMQVMPATFRQYARPGESIDNPEHNVRVGIRIIKDLGDRFGNDAAKIATGYFSGPGNVNPGAGAAWKHDRKDGNGKSVSSYAQDVVNRVNKSGAQAIGAAPRGQVVQPVRQPVAGAENPLLDISQVPSWASIQSSQRFQSASPQKQAAVKQRYFDEYIAPIAKHAGLDIDGERKKFLMQAGAATENTERTWGEAVGDTGKQLIEGTIRLANTPVQLFAPGSATANYLNAKANEWHSKQSEDIKRRQAAADEKIARFAEEGQQKAGMLGNIANAFGATVEANLTDPALAARTITTNLPSILVTAGLGKLVQAGLAYQGMNATRAAQMATTATGAINAISNAGDARGDAYQDIKNTLIRQGVSPDIAEEIALKQSVPSAVIGGGVGYLSGKSGLESAVMTKQAAREGAERAAAAAIKAGVKSAASEMLGEIPEEVLPQVATNLMAGRYDDRPVAQGVGRTIADTMIGAAPGSALAGGAGAYTEYAARQQQAQMQADAAQALSNNETPGVVSVQPPAENGQQNTQQPAVAVQPPNVHPTVEAADAIVRELAQEAGMPLELVLPTSAIDPAKEARVAELSMRAMDGEMEAAERAELAALQQDMAQEDMAQPQAPQQEQPVARPRNVREARALHRQTDILTADGGKVAAQWDVVEADSVQASLKEGVSQPRDRTRAASNAQVSQIAANPDWERLSDTSKTMDYGAPTLSSDNLIVGGNGRFEGVSQAYENGTADAYRAALEKNSWRLGLDGDAIRAMRKPVLVRRITENADTRQLAIQSNQPAGLQMSDMEQAALDAERMQGLERITVTATGDIPLTASNRQAIQYALDSYSTNEVAGMVGADGSLSQSGLRRVRNAILYRAYGKSETLARLIESPDADMKNVGTALVRAAGALAQVQDGLGDASIPAEFDIATDLTVAIETLSALRAEGMNLDEFLAQADMFGGELTAAQTIIIRMLADNLRSAKNITAFLHDYAQQVMSLQDSENGLLGQMPVPSKEEVLDRARQQHTAPQRASAAPELLARAVGSDQTVQAREGHRPDGARQSGDEDAREPGAGASVAEGRTEGGQESIEEAPRFSRSAMKDIDANIRRGREALARAVTEKTSVHRAMFRNGLGWVDFVWGDEKRGLAHILSRRQASDGMSEAQVLRFLNDRVVQTIAQGQEVRRTELNQAVRVQIAHQGAQASLVRRPGSNTWLLTAFEMSPDPVGRGATPRTGTDSAPIRSRHRVAGDAAIVPLQDDDSQVPRFNRKEQDEETTFRAPEVRNEQGELLAPNGAVSNLDERQWHQVRSPQFKAWFGDWEHDPENASKVVDENGEPRVVYHGTAQEDLSIFDLMQARQNADIPSFFFSTQKEEAEGYGDNVIAAFLNIRNPVEKPDANMRGAEVRKELEVQGVDGTVVEDDYSTEYAAFNANQIKSATGNSGAFDGSNPNILYQRSQQTQAAYEARIDELFAGGKPRSQGVRVLDRSDMLGLLGMGDGPVHVVESKVEQGRYNHRLTAADWKKVPEWLDNPAAVFDSDTQPGRLVFIAPELVRDAPVRMIIDPRPDGKGVNLLINAYDTERNPFARWINDGLLRYVDTKKTTSGAKSFQSRLTGLPDNRGRGNSTDVLAQSVGLQLPESAFQNKPGMRKILTEKNLAGYRKERALLSNQSSDTTGAPHDNRIIRDDSPDTQRAVSLLNRYFEGRGGDAHSFQGVRTEGIDSVVPLAQALGAKVVGVKVREGLTAQQLSAVERFNGARYQGYIYLDADTRRPHLAVLGHEMAHEMRAKRPDLYDRMVEAIRPYVKQKEYGHWALTDVVARKEKSFDKKREEFIGEVLSDGFMDPVFWRALGNKNKELLVQVQNFLARMLQKIAATVGYTRKTKAYLTDYERVMQIAGEVMAEYGLDQGRFHRMAGIDLAPLRNNPTYSRSVGTQQAYEQRIDELFAGAKPNRIGARILDRSDVLGLLGHADKPVLIAESKVAQGQVNHPRITAEVWKKIPQWLDAPAAVFESDTDGGLVFLAPETIHGSPVSLIVLPDKDGRNSLGVHLLLNAYDRSRSTPFGRWVRDGLLKYVDQKKFPALFESVAGRRLPGTALQNKPGTSRILTEKNLAGWRKENAPQFNRAAAQAESSQGDAAEPAQPRWEAPEPSKLDEFIYTFQNKHINLKRVQEAINRVVQINEQFDAYQKEELYHGRVAARTEKFLNREVRPLLMDMRLKGLDLGALEAYLWARHAKERNAQIAKVNPEMPDGGSGLTNAQVDQYLSGKDVVGEDGQVIVPGLKAEQRRLLEKLAVRVDDIIRGTEEVLIQYGLETRETIEAWRMAYAHYVPLHREDMDSGTPIGTGFSVKGSASKRATGSSRKVVDILAHVALQREAAITRGEKNRVGLALYGLALENPNADFWAVDKVPQIKSIDKRTGMVMVRPDHNYKSRNNVLAVRIGGQDRVIVFNERNQRAMRMVESLKNLDAEQLGWMMGKVAKATRYLSAINTQYNPVFGIVNGLRDVQSAVLNISSTPLRGKAWQVLKAVPAAMRAIWKIERQGRSGTAYDQIYDDMQMGGGTTGYREIFRMGADRAKALQVEFDSFNDGHAKKALKAFLNVLDQYNTAIENGTRLAAYKVALENGKSKDWAASVAKNITVNFNRKGKAATEIGAWYAFFNAAVQGSARTLETLKGPAGKKIIAGGVTLGMLQALVAAIGFDDDEWEDIPEFQKQRNFVLPTGDNTYVMFPYPLGFNVLPNLGRIPAELMLAGGKGFGNRVLDLMSVFLEAANPLGSATLLQTLAPSVADPVVALAENKSFAGTPIAKEDVNPLQPTPGFARAKDTSSHVSRGLAKGINWATGGTKYTPGVVSPTPDQLDYIFGSITGGAGRELNKAYQVTELMAQGVDVPENKKPLISRFVGTTDGDMAISARYWRNVKEINAVEQEVKGRIKDGENPVAYMREHPVIYIAKPAKRFANQIQKMRSERHRVEFDDKITETERTERLKKLDADIIHAMQEYNKAVADAKKQKAEGK